ncbi:MAG: twin-arginine translocase TatA/TatE family subunit [Candidatus Abyssobacteria bacterium SURF_5]|uniref:Sec-independent protein translocase protein TatA n=1 Tax=Abyssobacteria bacterium (strain SURF_5) TaxID=2093360 RepID=A0A3A4NDJ5_ABYX5|nr:MAG: twin-arginine translocase TatA/TatE family subunit [Candidatus Abyssubacteria bacterium SURF_5]
MIGWQELLIVMVIVMLVFGTSKISGIGKSMGTAIRDFRDSMKGEPEGDKNSVSPKEENASEEKEAGKIK